MSLGLWPRLRTGEVSPFVILRPEPKSLGTGLRMTPWETIDVMDKPER